MKKKYIVMAVACILALTAVIGSTVAAPTRSADKTGNTTVNIEDLDVALAAGVEEDIPVMAMPGQTINFKNYYVENTAGYDAYVRVTIDKQWPGNEAELDGSMISLLLGNSDKELNDWLVKETSEEQVILYYKKMLSGKTADETDATSVFLSGVSFDASMDNSYTDKTANITVTVDAVQAAVAKDAMLAEWGVLPEIDEDGNITAITE